MTAPNVRVLYIAYWGACEPLGQSLLVPSVTQLATCGANVRLVSFEKPEGLRDRAAVNRMATALEEANVKWTRLTYHKHPKWPATAFDILHGCARGISAGFRNRYDVVHARTFIGGIIGRCVAHAMGAAFVYHAEGFYPDEQVDAGVWRRDSAAHRLASYIDRILYATADGIIVLSHKAREVLWQDRLIDNKAGRAIVVPSCVDLRRFTGLKTRVLNPADQLKLVHCGNVRGRYYGEKIAQWFAALRRQCANAHLTFLTHEDPVLVGALCRDADLPDGSWSVKSIPHSEIPHELPKYDAGILFLRRGLSERGVSPTKVGEYWACGLPVLATSHVGDNDEWVVRHRIGVIVNDHSEQGYANSALQLLELLKDPNIRQRCREAAESHYGLRPACERQVELYREVLARRQAVLQVSHAR